MQRKSVVAFAALSLAAIPGLGLPSGGPDFADFGYRLQFEYEGFVGVSDREMVEYNEGAVFSGGDATSCAPCNPPVPMNPPPPPPPDWERQMIYVSKQGARMRARGAGSTSSSGTRLDSKSKRSSPLISADKKVVNTPVNTDYLLIRGTSKTTNAPVSRATVRSTETPQDGIEATPGEWVLVLLPSKQFKDGRWVSVLNGAHLEAPERIDYVKSKKMVKSWSATQ